MDFKLWVAKAGEETFVFYAQPEGKLAEALSGLLVEHHFVLHSPLKALYAQNAERLTWIADALGVRKDVALTDAARAVSFLASWTLTDEEGQPVPLTLQGYASLHPVLANAVSVCLEAKINPNIGNSDFFRSWASRQEGSSP